MTAREVIGREGASAMSVDVLAQEIRRVDGNHSLGAGALAEALMPFLSRRLSPAPVFDMDSSQPLAALGESQRAVTHGSQQAVPEAAVEAALKARAGAWSVQDMFTDEDEAPEVMRLALTAALPHLSFSEGASSDANLHPDMDAAVEAAARWFCRYHEWPEEVANPDDDTGWATFKAEAREVITDALPHLPVYREFGSDGKPFCRRSWNDGKRAGVESATEFRETFFPDAQPQAINAPDMDALRRDAHRLALVFDNCRVVYYPPNLEYPIEHSPHARKDCKDDILRAVDAIAAQATKGGG